MQEPIPSTNPGAKAEHEALLALQKFCERHPLGSLGRIALGRFIRLDEAETKISDLLNRENPLTEDEASRLRIWEIREAIIREEHASDTYSKRGYSQVWEEAQDCYNAFKSCAKTNNASPQQFIPMAKEVSARTP